MVFKKVKKLKNNIIFELTKFSLSRFSLETFIHIYVLIQCYKYLAYLFSLAAFGNVSHECKIQNNDSFLLFKRIKSLHS